MQEAPAWDLYVKGLIPLGHGHPLWGPEPCPDMGPVRLGDVGHFVDGHFCRLFNTMVQASQQPEVKGLDGYEVFKPPEGTIVRRPDAITQSHLHSKSLQSVSVSVTASAGVSGGTASAGVRFKCTEHTGALLMLKDPASKTYLSCEKHIDKYIRAHIADWLAYANDHHGLNLKEEELVFVSGTTKTSVWAEAAFHNNSSEGELVVSGSCFVPSVAGEFSVSIARSSAVVHHRKGPLDRIAKWKDDDPPEREYDQSIFVNYYRTKRRPFRGLATFKASAGPHELPEGDPHNDSAGEGSLIVCKDDSFETFGESYDPVILLLNYILENSNAGIASATDVDLIRLLRNQAIPNNLHEAIKALSPQVVVDDDGVGKLVVPASGTTAPDHSVGCISFTNFQSLEEKPSVLTALPDPSQFPDPYPIRRSSRWHIGNTTPVLSSADSSSASTRSSAYTNSAKSGDYGHVHVALGDDEPGRGVGVGITTDDVVQLLSKESGASATTQGRTPVDQTRWSDFYQSGLRSRSSSLANSKPESTHEKAMPPLRGTPSFDMGWQRPDERDEVGLGSDDEMDDDPSFDDDEDEDEEEEEEAAEEPTSAAIMAEDGRGVIVRGDDTPIVKLQVTPDTTHLLIGSSPTPNSVPSFLATTLPQIGGSLLALDISVSFLSALPPALAACTHLEELNIAANPLRVLPTFLSNLTNLRVLIVDSTGLSTLPENLASLDKLHTLSIRGNKMHSLPSWLCVLPCLGTLLVDGNPFQGPWKALMEPLLSRGPLPPSYKPSTPVSPLPSASIRSAAISNTDGNTTEEESPSADSHDCEDEDLTVVFGAPHLARSIAYPSPGLSRTRTTPSRAYLDVGHTSSNAPQSIFSEAGPSNAGRATPDSEKEVHRMKSAEELPSFNHANSLRAPSASASSSPQRNTLTEYVTSASNYNLRNMAISAQDGQADPPRLFASLGPAEEQSPEPVPPLPSNKLIFPQERAYAMDHAPPPRPRLKDDKSSRWAFLRKISMNKMHPDQAQPPLDRLKRNSNEAAKLGPNASSSNLLVPAPAPTSSAAKRRSFLPIDMSPIPIPSASQFVPGMTVTNAGDDTEEPAPPAPSPFDEFYEDIQCREEGSALGSVMSYLRDMHDLSQIQAPTMSMYGESPAMPLQSRSRWLALVYNGRTPSEVSSSISTLVGTESVNFGSIEDRVRFSRSSSSTRINSVATTDSAGWGSGEEWKYKDDEAKRARIIREIVESERTYVSGLKELVDIYIKPAAAPVPGLGGVGQSKETVVPAQERKIVFGGVEALFVFHQQSFLPALERAATPILSVPSDKVEAQLTLDVAQDVANTFVSHAAFMKMYSTYINNLADSLQRIKTWFIPDGGSPAKHATLSSSQRKRIKAYLKRCRMDPRYSQPNLDGYLLLPLQRIPRYRLMLEELVRSSPPMSQYKDDPIDRALTEISSLASNMNEGKREAESRHRLVQWQARIRGKFPSPLVQPHRRLIMDGPLKLTRVVRKKSMSFEIFDAQGDASSVEVECLSPELTPRSLIGVLCNDLLVLCRDPTDGQDPTSVVNLWAVLRMETLPHPASIVHGTTLRLVDSKAILYLDAPSTSDAWTWLRAIDLQRDCSDQ